MPLRAIVDGKIVIAPFLDDKSWDELKKKVKTEKLEVRVPCCNNLGYLRTSKRGLHHFGHKVRGDCTSEPETWQHLKAKDEIIRACKEVGYDAIPECQGEGWRADVLAQKGNIQIAFEVQWSPQTWETTKERQQKLTDSNVRGCWLFKSPPPQYKANADVPLFKLEVSEDSCTVVFNPSSYEYSYGNRQIPLSEFIVELLSRKLKYCDVLKTRPKQQIGISFLPITCWKCNKPYHVYYMHALTTYCGEQLEGESTTWADNKYYFSPQIVAIVREITRSNEGKHIQLSRIKKRYSRTVGKSYMSFGCPHCDALYGDMFLSTDYLYAGYDDPQFVQEVLLENAIELDHPHWCYSEDGHFCCS